jgi:hypothetical protein
VDVSDTDELGTLERVGNVSVLGDERRLVHPPKRVWRALTAAAELAALCEGTEPPWKPSARWQHVHRAYVERPGPAASVIGPPG